MKKYPISAIVVGKDEAALLNSCLSKLKFCDEIIYVDLGSSDASVEIAEKNEARIIKFDSVPIVEIVHSKVVDQTRHKAVLITDPDEQIDDRLIEQIDEFLEALFLGQEFAAIYVPMINYFKDVAIKGTIWGGKDQGRILLVNKDRFEFKPFVHNGRIPKNGFRIFWADRNLTNTNVVHHFWAQSVTQLVEKHKRYILKEGEARYSKGLRTNYFKICTCPFIHFYDCFFKKQGYKDGLLGFGLSLFWAWYQTSCEFNLLAYQKNKHR